MYCWHDVPASLLLPTTLYSTPCGCSGCGEEQLCHTIVPNGIGAVVGQTADNEVASYGWRLLRFVLEVFVDPAIPFFQARLDQFVEES